MNKIAKDHAEFLSEFAYNLGRLFGAPDDEMDAVSEFVQWFAEATITHGIKHGIEYSKQKSSDDQVVGGKSEIPTQADIARLWNENEQRHRRNSNL